MAPFYLLLLPALVYGKISVYVDLKSDPPLIDVTGTSEILLPEQERSAFKMEDVELKKSVANYSGTVPKDVLIANGLVKYTAYKWLEVRRTVKPTLETITNARIARQPCGDVPNNVTSMTSSVKIERTVNGTNTTLSKTEQVGYKILYAFDTLNFTSTWGADFSQDPNFTPPPKTGLQKCILHVYLQYVARLSGSIVANYEPKREGHNIWAFDVNRVQRAAGLPTSVIYQDHVQIKYYQNKMADA